MTRFSIVRLCHVYYESNSHGATTLQKDCMKTKTIRGLHLVIVVIALSLSVGILLVIEERSIKTVYSFLDFKK